MYGSSEWAQGAEPEKEDPPAVPATGGNPFTADGSSEGWSIMQKGLLFGVIIAIVAVWVTVTRRRNAKKEDVGYEKVLS
ncbi:MAG: Peptidyl-prolyl cis-trans isomerase B [Sporothrix thermara]